MPAEESGSNTNMWTSFDYANAHFISIDTETDYPHAPEGVDTIFKAGGFGDQLAWLEQDLAKAAANRAERPWIIVGGHRPLYTASKKGLSSIIWPNTTGHLRAFVEDLFHKYNVDLYLCGHVHAVSGCIHGFSAFRLSIAQSMTLLVCSRLFVHVCLLTFVCVLIVCSSTNATTQPTVVTS